MRQELSGGFFHDEHFLSSEVLAVAQDLLTLFIRFENELDTDTVFERLVTVAQNMPRRS